ncbi:hypothetical protein GN244_ATG16380 [Phytophthora infestans]|uniref:Uncharacterized protein n=1 Tax=Phytophthora infestans TaxID=4787 RepID=A0A833SIG2_PHYIN|nr:hypothetical protein GN244_ATG16380 [Phytophthora infestans]KAF4129262.1 hypothetical protein GN958_ATG21526 [Phytophthora infestans]
MKTNRAGDNSDSVKRFFRMQGTSDDEERGNFKDVVDKATRKAKKLALYNKWIFADKIPEGVTMNHPAFAIENSKFRKNRMVRGGKYN